MDPAKYGYLPASGCTSQYPNGPFGYDRITVFDYDANDRPVRRIVAAGVGDETIEVVATYTPNGQIETLLDGNDNKTSYAYDGHDRLSRTYYPVQAQGAATSNLQDYEELGYDPRSLVTSRRLRDGRSIGYAYDALGRVTYKDVPNAAFYEHDVSLRYDNLDRPTEIAYPGEQALVFAYDALGRKLSETSFAGTVRSQYDAAGRRTRLTWRDGYAVDYAYHVTGEMTAITEVGSGANLVGLQYDDRGRRTRLTRGNGTATDYAYDPTYRLQQQVNHMGGNGGLALTFAYNPAGQIVENGRSNDLYSWTPGAEATDYAVNGRNQLTQIGGASVTHDARGNLTSDGVRSFGYTAENRLAESYGSGVHLAYDPLGRLFYLSSNGGTRFTYDGADMIDEAGGAIGPIFRPVADGRFRAAEAEA